MSKYCSRCGTGLFDGQFICPICSDNKRRWQEEQERKAQSSRSENKSKSCFVATVAFGDPNCVELDVLREFRDKKLAKNIFGRFFIRWYYNNGERLANWIESRPIVKKSVREILTKLVRKLNKINSNI